MAIRTRTSDGYQQVELTSELLHSQSGTTQQVISTVPCTKHLPFFFSILLADIFLFGSVLLFAIHAAQYGDGFSYDKSSEFPLRQFNLHALIMITAFIYLNGGLYMTYQAQEAVQANRPKVSHFYSLHSWTGLITVGLFTIQFLFGFFSFFVTLCCRKLTARMRAKALPVHRTFAMIVLCTSVASVISGLSQLARFQLTGTDGRADYRDVSMSTILINLAGICVMASMVLIFLITFIFKRRQAHDLPVLFKIILSVAQFVEIVLILVVAEFIFQLVTPHVNKAINSEFIGNATLTHIFNNATQSISSFISTATQHVTNGLGGGDSNNSTQLADQTSNSSIILGTITNTTT